MEHIFNSAFTHATKQCSKTTGRWICQALGKEVTACPLSNQKDVICCQNLSLQPLEQPAVYALEAIKIVSNAQKHTQKIQ